MRAYSSTRIRSINSGSPGTSKPCISSGSSGRISRDAGWTLGTAFISVSFMDWLSVDLRIDRHVFTGQVALILGRLFTGAISRRGWLPHANAAKPAVLRLGD